MVSSLNLPHSREIAFSGRVDMTWTCLWARQQWGSRLVDCLGAAALPTRVRLAELAAFSSDACPRLQVGPAAPASPAPSSRLCKAARAPETRCLDPPGSDTTGFSCCGGHRASGKKIAAASVAGGKETVERQRALGAARAGPLDAADWETSKEDGDRLAIGKGRLCEGLRQPGAKPS